MALEHNPWLVCALSTGKTPKAWPAALAHQAPPCFPWCCPLPVLSLSGLNVRGPWLKGHLALVAATFLSKSPSLSLCQLLNPPLSGSLWFLFMSQENRGWLQRKIQGSLRLKLTECRGAEGGDMRGSLPRMPDTNGAEAPRAPHQLSSQPDKVP